ncbi:MAG: PKD domain-containing protein, partial [Treponema sp.]|nr:PKD domain-containing protein [Treponema sp.]
MRNNPRVPRMAALGGLGAFFAGAVFLVSFAIAAPEHPPRNLESTLKEMADSGDKWGNSYASIRLSAEDTEWTVLAWDEADERTGAGPLDFDRSSDIEYAIRPGEALSKIAQAYTVSSDLLAFYNNITNADRIRAGTIIKIPSLENAAEAEKRMAKQPRRNAAPAKVSTKNIKVVYETRNSGAANGITVQFSVVDPSAETLQSFEWDFGDGKRDSRTKPNPSHEYTAPKTYVARLTARDAAGNLYRSNPLYIDVPHPGSAPEQSDKKFVTLSSLDDYFVVQGVVTAVARYSRVEDAPLDFSESDQFLTKVRFTRPGFYGITVSETGGNEQYYSVFASPIPTMHADAAPESFDWYRTQYNTGTTSNCGPASASMAIGWSMGKYFPVSSVRQAIGWQGDGGTSLEELLKVIKVEGVSASIQPFRSVQHIKDVIDSGGIAVVLFHTAGVQSTRMDPAADLFGKYYNDSVGHYIVIKGYSLNGEYFVIYDPIPSDWGANSFRYSDDVSMIGRNRYYS